MAARIQNATSQPDITAGVQHLFKAVYAGGVPPQTLELVHLRASQINGRPERAGTDAGPALGSALRLRARVWLPADASQGW